MKWFDKPVLGIESSCDETSVAITFHQMVKANVVSSQADLHRQWGGVVPEVASRAHVEAMLPTLERALADAELNPQEIGAIAVTNRPGLIGALSVGVTTAKALSLSWNLPLIGVHHLEGHLVSPLANRPEPLPFPHLCLIVSGGHTELVLVRALGNYETLCETLDDAAGEAFDKGARILGLGYPGGQRIQASAMKGDPSRYVLPIAIPDDLAHFSFSGLKTAVLRLAEKEGDRLSIEDASASLQAAIIEALAVKTRQALDESGVKCLTLVGGVAANLALRERLSRDCQQSGVEFCCPELSLCTDNAAMIALAGSLRLASGQSDNHLLETMPNQMLSELTPP